MAEQYINMDNLAVGYNGKALIHDICIGIEKGEIVTLIGPNGAGKSTILKSITRQLKIISGNVTIAEENLTKLSFRDPFYENGGSSYRTYETGAYDLP